MKASDPPIIIEHQLNASVDQVWKALTNVEEMRQWYFPQIDQFKAELGSRTQFLLEHNGRSFTHQWEVTSVNPKEHITYRWTYKEYQGDSEVKFELLKQADHVLLRVSNFVFEDFPQDIPEFNRASGVEGWEYLIGTSLKGFLKGR